MALFPRLRKRIAARRAKQPAAGARTTDADDLESVAQQLKELLPKQKGRPMRNWLTGFVATTGFKYLVTMVATFIATQIGLDEGAVEAILVQLVAVGMGIWGMWESSRNKAVIDGVKVSIPKDATVTEAKAAVGEAMHEAKVSETKK